jgi:hypothetical protein
LLAHGVSAVRWAVGGPTAPYFRFPALRQPQELIDYLGKRNIAQHPVCAFWGALRRPRESPPAISFQVGN